MILCPMCGEKTTTINQVDAKNNEVYREKKCTVCEYLFYTVEFDIEQTPEFRAEWLECRRQKQRKYTDKEKEN